MRRLPYIITCLFIIIGCSDRLSDGRLILSQDEVSCTEKGGRFEIAVTGRADWVTDNTAKWISVERSSGKAVIFIDENPGFGRERIINFKAGGKALAGLRIYQDNSKALDADQKKIMSGYKGGEFTTSLTCFETWSAESHSEWISVSPTEGEGPEELTVTVRQNDDITGREGRVSIRSGEVTLTLEVHQDPKPYIETETGRSTFDGDGGYADILYMSNTEVDIVSDNDWIRLIRTEGSIKKVSFEVLRNLAQEREGSITIYSAVDHNIYRKISVVQGERIDHPRLGIAEGTHLVLESKAPVRLHPVFEEMADTTVQWSSSDKEVAEIDADGTVTIHKGGTCTMTVRNAFHSLSADIILEIMPKAESMTIFAEKQDMSKVPVAVRFVGEKNELKVIMTPSDAYSEDVTFFSPDPQIAEIIGNMLYCIAPGKTTIYAESLYQGLRGEFTLIVLE